MKDPGEPEPDVRGAKRKARWLQAFFVLTPLAGFVLFQVFKTAVPLFIAVGFDLGLIAWSARQPWNELLKGESIWFKW